MFLTPTKFRTSTKPSIMNHNEGFFVGFAGLKVVSSYSIYPDIVASIVQNFAPRYSTSVYAASSYFKQLQGPSHHATWVRIGSM